MDVPTNPKCNTVAQQHLFLRTNPGDFGGGVPAAVFAASGAEKTKLVIQNIDLIIDVFAAMPNWLSLLIVLQCKLSSFVVYLKYYWILLMALCHKFSLTAVVTCPSI